MPDHPVKKPEEAWGGDISYYSAQLAFAEAANRDFELLPRLSSYVPGLAPSDLFLFSTLKYHLCDLPFENNDEFICAEEKFLED